MPSQVDDRPLAALALEASISNLKITTEADKRARFEAWAAINTGTNTTTEYLRCKARFAYFLRYVRLPDVNKGLIPYELWGYLLEIADDWQQGDSWVEGKSRQLGYSWLLAAYDVWIGTFRPFARILSFSIHQKESDELLEKVKSVNRFLPDWLRKDLLDERKDYVKWEGTEAEMHSLPSTGKAGRSYTATLVQTDEWAFHENAQEHYSAYRPAVADGGQHLAISTGSGVGNMFHKYFISPATDIPYRKRFNGWRTRPGHDDRWYAKERAAFLVDALDAESESFGKHPGLFKRENPEQISDMFETFVGLVYDCFNERLHVKPIPFDWRQAKRRVAAIDPGQGDPFAAVVIGESAGGHAHQFAEFYEAGVVAEDRIALWLLAWHEIAPFDAIWVDGVEGTLIATLQARGLPAFAANKERATGIGHVYGRLEANNYTVSSTCRHTIREYKTYQWRRKRSRGGQEEWDTSTPEDHHGDAMDATRYALVGLAKGFQQTLPAGAQPTVTRTKAGEDLVLRVDPLTRQLYDPGVKKPSLRGGPDLRRRATLARRNRQAGPNLARIHNLNGSRR